MLAYHKIGVPECVGAIDAVACNNRRGLLRWVCEGVDQEFVGWVLGEGHDVNWVARVSR